MRIALVTGLFAILFMTSAAYSQNETFDYSISTNPSSGAIIQVTAGSSAAVAVSLALLNGTSQPVTFSCSGLPDGGSCSFDPSSCNPTCSSTMTISVPSNTTPWTYTYLAIQSSGGGVQHGKWYYSLQVSAPPPSYSNCTQGAISSGCYCGRGNIDGLTPEFSGYCCWGSYSPTACATTVEQCTDSDNGINIYVKGTGSGNYIGSTTRSYMTLEDSCATSTQLNEVLCDTNGYLSTYGAYCGNGCSNGACINQTTAPSCSVDSDCLTANVSGIGAWAGATFCDSTGLRLMQYKESPTCQSGTCVFTTSVQAVKEDCSASNKICEFTTSGGGVYACIQGTPPGQCTLNAQITTRCTCGPGVYGGAYYNWSGYNPGYCCSSSSAVYQTAPGPCPVCSSSSFADCYTSVACTAAGGYWCNNYCQPTSCSQTQQNTTNSCPNGCNTPPSTTCDGGNVRSYYSSGTCNDGVCSYPSSTYQCPYGCSNGACKPYTVGTPSGGGGGGGGGAVACPAGCSCKYDSSGNVISSLCQSHPACNNNGICEKGEENGCRDCVGGECPVEKKCSDGSTVACYGTASTCRCDPCPVPANTIPYGCRQETDPSGFIRVACDNYKATCPAIDKASTAKCSANGGYPMFRHDNNGCDYFYCNFGSGPAPSLFTNTECPTSDSVSVALQKCDSLGLQSVVAFENGCKIGKCVQQGNECPTIGETEKNDAAQKCSMNGQSVAVAYNENGCQYLRCENQNYCQKDLPKEAYSSCADKGGQVIVNRDDRGCVLQSQCVARGDSASAYVENVNSVPDSSELLGIAFKLENLRVQFDGLGKKSSDIADYYRTRGSAEEKRFQRVSDMFYAARDRVDEIRAKIRQKLDSLTIDDVIETKSDVRYIKDVIIKDVLYVMLGSGDDIDGLKSGTAKDCGSDESCFNSALRICQPVKFVPEGSGIAVELRGLDGSKCVLYASKGDMDMTCNLERYSLGVKDASTDIFPYCSGTLVGVVKQMATNNSRVPTIAIPAVNTRGGNNPNEQCRGCFDNGVCDAGECTSCADCQAVVQQVTLQDFRGDMNNDGRIDDADKKIISNVMGLLSDINNDKRIDARDISRLEDMVSSGSCPNSGCDLNGDDRVNSNDASLIKDVTTGVGFNSTNFYDPLLDKAVPRNPYNTITGTNRSINP